MVHSDRVYMSTVRMRKGFFMIFALWLFLLLSLFCLGLGLRTHLLMQKTKLYINRIRASWAAVSGVTSARAILISDQNSVDHLGENWAHQSAEGPLFVCTYERPKRQAQVHVAITDESARVDLNQLAARVLSGEALETSLLAALFDECDVPESEVTLQYLLDYIDPDVLERSVESERGVKNGPLNVPEELLCVQTIEASDYERLKDVITVNSNGTVNINTADRRLRELLIYASTADEETARSLSQEVLAVRSGVNGIEGDDDDGFYGEGGAPLSAALGKIFVTTSDIFRIMSRATVDNVTVTVTCVIDRRAGEHGHIRSWYEE